jgi:hypothetical protein
MGFVACSTSICPGSECGASAVMDHWEDRCRDLLEALAVDHRFNPQRQERLLRLCRLRGVRSVELSHPHIGPEGLPTASVVSSDRHEQRAALLQLTDTLQRAVDYGVERIHLPPTEMGLAISRESLGRDFALDQASPGPEELRGQRDLRATAAMDAICLVLDPLLRTCDDLGGTVALPGPTPWPHLFPDLDESAQLLEIFAGAPIEADYCTDWAHVQATLTGSEPAPPPEQLHVLRLADACGLTSMLPPGTGEIDWDEQVTIKEDNNVVLTLRPDTTRDEVVRSCALLERLRSERDEEA